MNGHFPFTLKGLRCDLWGFDLDLRALEITLGQHLCDNKSEHKVFREFM